MFGLVFFDWILSLGVIISGFNHVITYIITEVLLTNTILLYRYVVFDGYLGCFSFLVMMSNAAMNNFVQVLCGYMVFSSLEYTQNIDLGVELLSHIVTKEPPIDFSVSQVLLVFYNLDSFDEYHSVML